MNNKKIFTVLVLSLILLSGCSFTKEKPTQTEAGNWVNSDSEFTNEEGEILSTFDNNKLNAERE